MFTNRTLLIATQHKKEQVIAPILERELGVRCIVNQGFDTDTLGTFTGEIERKDDPIATARTKCLQAMQQQNCDLGIASEGSFGPHPDVFFLPADDEFLIFIDTKNQIEVVVRETDFSTNFAGKSVSTEEELRTFASQVGFPSHGLILSDAEKQWKVIYKGIQEEDVLLTHFETIKANSPTVFVRTDMRAMYNPTRMQVIEKAAQKLAKRLQITCPSCQTPGFDATEAIPGLPCSLCAFPTRSPISYLYTCPKCAYQEEKKFPNGKTSEDPAHCDFCNP